MDRVTPLISTCDQRHFSWRHGVWKLPKTSCLTTPTQTPQKYKKQKSFICWSSSGKMWIWSTPDAKRYIQLQTHSTTSFRTPVSEPQRQNRKWGRTELLLLHY